VLAGSSTCSTVSRLLNTTSVPEVAQLGKLSKSQISHIEQRRCTPSARLVETLLETTQYVNSRNGEAEKALGQLPKSRCENLSNKTLDAEKGWIEHREQEGFGWAAP
jgi:transcriptional regulator with XRE-family HTH domain